jgi:hypothetical protein
VLISKAYIILLNMAKFDEIKRTASIVIFLSLLILLVGYAMFSSGTHQVAEGVTTIDILGLCNFDVYDLSAQPQVTIAYRCPGIETIRVWPFPVVMSWKAEDFSD